jgi:hypothetical protein
VKLSDVNTTDIADAIRLGCQTMCSVFNKDDGDIPFFKSCVWPDAYLAYEPYFTESHVPGRHLNALLVAEDVLQHSICESCIEKHANAAYFSYSGPIPFPLNRLKISDKNPSVFPVHNLREGFHALHALVKYRHSGKARQLAQQSIQAILKHWDRASGWDAGYFERHGIKLKEEDTFPMSIGRALGPIVKVYLATRYQPAMELAERIATKAIEEFFLEAGECDFKSFGYHVHSITSTLSSLAQYADATGDETVKKRVKAFYDNALWTMRDETGWVKEDMHPQVKSDEGECNSTGDVVETALILGKWGYLAYYHDAERMLRSHLLPAQLRDVSFINEPDNPNQEDGRRNVVDRHIGAFGFPAPYGHKALEADEVKFNMDIVGGTVASLCEAYRQIARTRDNTLYVHLLFDYEDENIIIKSPYTNESLDIVIRTEKDLYVRIPPWVSGRDIRVTLEQNNSVFKDDHLLITGARVGERIRIDFPLTIEQLTLRHRTHDIPTTFKGDVPIAMENFGEPFTFFDKA